MLPHGGGAGAADRRHRHHVQLDHHVLPPRDGRRAAHDHADGPLPHHRPHPDGRGEPHRRAGGTPWAVPCTGPRRELADAVAANHPYPRWAATLGWAGPGGRGGGAAGRRGLTIAASAFAVTALIDRLGRLLGRFGVAPFFLQMVGASVATVSTLALFGIGALPAGTQSSLVIAAGITVLLSGLSVVGTVQDAISGFYVTAGGPGGRGGVLSAGLLTGVDPRVEAGRRVRAHPGPGRTGGRRLQPVLALRVRGGDGGGHVRAGQVRAHPVAARGRPRGRHRVGGVRGAHTVRAPRPGGVDRRGGDLRRDRHRAGAGAARRALARDRRWPGSSRCCPASPPTGASTSWPSRAWSDGLVTVLLALAIGLALAAGVALGNFVARPRVTRAVVQPD